MRKTANVIVLSLTITFLAVSGKLADASYQKPKLPIPPPGTVKNVKVIRRMNVYVTAYYGPRLGQPKYAHGSFKKDVRINGAGKETRSGTIPTIGTAAADWSVLKKGTKFRIIGCDVPLGQENPKPLSDIIFTVEDTGGGVKGKHVDIFTGHGEHACKVASNFDCRKYMIEVVE